MTLKNCPFCGGEAFLPEDSGDREDERSVTCVECLTIGPGAMSDEGAIEAWNRRPSPWVRVSGRFPEEGREVLGCWTPKCLGLYSIIGRTCIGPTVWNNGEWVNPDDPDESYAPPTHWMPLPERPEE